MCAVNVEGIGFLPHGFSNHVDGFDLDNKDGANGYDESKVSIVRNGVDWFSLSDEIEVSGEHIAGGYKLIAYFNSEVDAGIFGDGRMELTYDETTHHWTALGYLGKEGVEDPWKFTDGYAAVNILVAGLNYMFNKTDFEYLNALAESIDRDVDAIVTDMSKREGSVQKTNRKDRARQPDRPAF